jgi:hypothetical protein
MKIPNIKHGWIWLIPLSAAILTVDFFSGRGIQFSLLYVLPVALSGWIGHKRMAYVLAIFLPAFRLAFFIPWDEAHALNLGIVNAVIRATALIIMAYLADRARRVIELQKELKILQGILPICMSCKRIRNEKGEYEQLEAFIHHHSEADFSHGYCPDCVKKIYPQYSHSGQKK